MQGFCWYHLKHYQERLSILVRRGNRLDGLPRVLTDRPLQSQCQRNNLGATLNPPVPQRLKAIYPHPGEARRISKRHLKLGHQEGYYGWVQDCCKSSFVGSWKGCLLSMGPPFHLKSYQKTPSGPRFSFVPPSRGMNHVSSLFQTSWDFREIAPEPPKE